MIVLGCHLELPHRRKTSGTRCVTAPLREMLVLWSMAEGGHEDGTNWLKQGSWGEMVPARKEKKKKDGCQSLSLKQAGS